MSYNTGQPPTPVSESTAIEVRRTEGTVHSYVAIGTIAAGSLVKLTNSGLVQTVGTEDPAAVLGVTLYTATSGSRIATARGQMRVTWDGVGTVTPGVEVQASITNSGWFTANNSGTLTSVGRYDPMPGYGTLVAANSGTLQVITLP